MAMATVMWIGVAFPAIFAAAHAGVEHVRRVDLDAGGHVKISRSIVRTAKSRAGPDSEKVPTDRMCFQMPAKHYMQEHSTFLPQFETRISPSAVDGSAKQTLHSMWSQQAKRCPTTRRSKAVDMEPYGFGSGLGSLLKPMTKAYLENLAFVTPVDPLGRPITHYGLMPTSHCPASGTESSGWTDMPQSEIAPLLLRNAKLLEKVKPGTGQIANKDHFWWTAQQWAWLLRPNATLDQHLHNLKAQLNWEQHRPVLGLHVRQGDACTREGGRTGGKGRHCDNLSTYMESVMKLAKAYGYKSIYLATDSAEVVINSTQYTDFTWIHSPTRRTAQRRDPHIYFDDLWLQKPTRRDFNDLLKQDFLKQDFGVAKSPSLVQQEGQQPESEAARSRSTMQQSFGDTYDFDAEFHDLYVDLMLLADSDGLVGKFTSNVDRMAYALGVGQSGCAKPYISLDSMWCNDFGNEVGKLIEGGGFFC